jgi:hypothetical protein
MFFLSAVLIFVSLSVAAIPLSPNHQSPRSPSSPLDSLPLSSLPLPAGLPLLDSTELLKLGKKKPKPAYGYSKKNVFGRFIMDADYASGSGPPAFFGKSPHKRDGPLSIPFDTPPLPFNDAEEDITP